MTKLQTWMDKNGMRDHQVAAAVNRSRVQINRIRRGITATSVTTARKLQRLTGIPWHHFISDDKPKRRVKAKV